MSNENVGAQAGGNSSPPVDMRRIIVAGFIGGLMTPLIQPMKEFLASHHTPSDFGVWYWIIGLGLGVLGSVMVWLLKETDVKKAMVLGLSLPAFFTSLGGAVQNSGDNPTAARIQERRPSAALPVGVILSTANAKQDESHGTNEPAPARSIEVSIDGQPFAYTLEILDSHGAAVGDPIDVSATDSVLLARPLPASAAAARFTAGSQPPLVEKFNARDGYTVEITLRGQKFTRKFSVAQVLGKTPDFIPDALSASVQIKEKAPVGARGWIYIGTLRNGTWDSEHTVEGADIPKVGETRQIIYSVNLRDASASTNPPQAIVWVFQRVRFLQVTAKNTATWAEVEVVG
jgi:hypothetical protein